MAGGGTEGTCPPPFPLSVSQDLVFFCPYLASRRSYAIAWEGGAGSYNHVRVYYYEPIYEPERMNAMATKKHKQPAVTSFFSPAPKRRAPEEHSVSADENMQLPHDSMGQETRPLRPETEVASSYYTPEARFPGHQDPHSNLDIADFVTASSLSIPDKVQYRVIRRGSLHCTIVFPTKPPRTARGRVEPTNDAVV